jgi:hypothetical protein
MAQSSNVQLKKGTQYQAVVTLTGLQSIATNSQVEDKFRELGFTNVSSAGNGNKRLVKGTWSQEDQTIPMPDQVSDVRTAIPSLV